MSEKAYRLGRGSQHHIPQGELHLATVEELALGT